MLEDGSKQIEEFADSLGEGGVFVVLLPQKLSFWS